MSGGCKRVEKAIDYHFSHATVKLGLALFPLFALALDMPENFFEDKVCSMTRLQGRRH